MLIVIIIEKFKMPNNNIKLINKWKIINNNKILIKQMPMGMILKSIIQMKMKPKVN